MKVFISWSGKDTKSHAVALALDEWLPTVLNAAEPWVSTRGLTAGLQWNQQLDRELDDTHFGIIVVTPWNQHSQWLNFEAGALSKRVGGAEARVAPLLIDFPNMANLKGPLSSYQAVLPTKEGMNDLIVSVNSAMGESAREYKALSHSFEVCWPALEAALTKINETYRDESDPTKVPHPEPKAVDDTDMLSEILSAVRSLSRSDARLTSALSASAATNPPRESPRKEFAPGHAVRSLGRFLMDSGFKVKSIRNVDGRALVVLADYEEGVLLSTAFEGEDLEQFGVREVAFKVGSIKEEPFFLIRKGGVEL